MTGNLFILAISGLAVAGMLLRPFNWPEAVWPAAGAALLVVTGLLPWQAAAAGVAQGGDVYLFLTGMMLLAELARGEGLFDWLAAHAVRAARGSARRLFGLLYLVGTGVTVFLSNDATAVVLTPAVAAVMRAAGLREPLPFLFICAFIANAASFVLPISNPANLVVYAGHMPPLFGWLRRFALPSAAAILATFIMLRATQRQRLDQAMAARIELPALGAGGRITACGIAGMALLLMLASGFGLRLGLPVFGSGVITALAVWLPRRRFPAAVLKDISWSVLLLVAGLFVLVQGLAEAGVLRRLTALFEGAAASSPGIALWGGGVAVGIACNLVNNLPAGLVAGHAAAGAPGRMTGALLLGVDVGPNLSVTGSLATILWLSALKRERIRVTAWQFLKLGALVMPPALLAALLALAA